jgi:hypothetical protein
MKKIKSILMVFVFGLAAYGTYSLYIDYGTSVKQTTSKQTQKLIKAARAFQKEINQ